ncbi:hypothetical protein OEZ85_012041 [Tetradesmus obliquus]|uniref:3-hydroxyisobutyryl-CoA hydrolase n=1 Tax=Tetradesmus obliquus TaxID=3088 RepID=A0ABY8TSV9_TETOB|nr:hypothetical protein OEZ85_012041 [Tetradesmus obliquus]
MSEPVILAKVEQGVGKITLNRPRALNSLNTEMVTQMYQVYRAWSNPDSGVRAILLTGAGGKAFCAGGDVKTVAQQVMAGQQQAAMAFFQAEYVTDAAISQLALPHISLLDGITMGGGAGVSMHGHFRVATERTLFAMPECAIGLFPDVGMMALLPHLPGELGSYLALTGARLSGLAVKQAGLATHFIPSSHLHEVKQQLQQAGPAASDLAHVYNSLTNIEAAAAAEQGAGGAAAAQQQQQQQAADQLFAKLPIINRCFGKASVAQIVAALQAETAEPQWCREALQQLQRGSPLSAAVTLAYYRRSRAASLSAVDCLQLDGVLCGHFTAGDGDFAEGVRARLIDKEDKPCWKHASAEQVPDDLVQQFFRPRSQQDVIALHDALTGPPRLPAAASKL